MAQVATLPQPLMGKGLLPLPFQGGGWEGDGLILANDAVPSCVNSASSLLDCRLPNFVAPHPTLPGLRFMSMESNDQVISCTFLTEDVADAANHVVKGVTGPNPNKYIQETLEGRGKK